MYKVNNFWNDGECILNTNKLLSKFSIVLIVMLSVGLRHLPSKIQLIVGLPIFSALLICAIVIRGDFITKAILIIGALSGILYLLLLVVTQEIIKQVIYSIVFILLTSFLIVDRLRKHKQNPSENTWRKRDILTRTLLVLIVIIII
jgi:hypothetical protein